MTNATKTIAETAKQIRDAILAAGNDRVTVRAANGSITFESDSYDSHKLREAVELARPIARASGRKASFHTVRGYRYFRVGQSATTLRAAFKFELSEDELTSVILGRHDKGTSF